MFIICVVLPYLNSFSVEDKGFILSHLHYFLNFIKYAVKGYVSIFSKKWNHYKESKNML